MKWWKSSLVHNPSAVSIWYISCKGFFFMFFSIYWCRCDYAVCMVLCPVFSTSHNVISMSSFCIASTERFYVQECDDILKFAFYRPVFTLPDITNHFVWMEFNGTPCHVSNFQSWKLAGCVCNPHSTLVPTDLHTYLLTLSFIWMSDFSDLPLCLSLASNDDIIFIFAFSRLLTDHLL